MSDQDHLDSFLESAGISAEPAPEVVTTATPAIPETAPETGQPRDEVGRFAPKATTGEPAAELPPTEQPPHTQPGAHTVPLEALTAIRGENRDLKQQLQQAIGRLQALEQRPQTQPPAQPQQPQPKRELWDDPDGYVADRLTPVQQALAETRAEISHLRAVADFGKESVTAAHEAVNEAINRGELDRAKVNGQLAQSRDPVGDLVRWHQQQQAKANMQRIGNNPDAWLEAELEKRMADPSFQAKVIERARQPNGQNTQSPPVALPPSLSRIASGANAPGGDLSGEGLFAHATAGMR